MYCANDGEYVGTSALLPLAVALKLPAASVNRP